jgi:NACHT domain- and WD repeat-containing protein
VPQTRTFRVFVSSTFRDLEVERNYLRENVYPDLRALCAEHGSRFQAIDLRWGVSREASLDQQAMNVCLEEIDRCREVTPRPNFVVLLGNRHGWLAPPPQIPAEELDKILEHVRKDQDKNLITGPEGWYRRDDNADPPEYYLRPREGRYENDTAWEPVEARLHAILAEAAKETEYQHDPKYTASATEQEILHGALGMGALEGRAFCFVRALSGEHPDPAKANRGDPILDFVDSDQAPLKKLKDALGDELACIEYEARWDPRTERPTTDHLEQLARDVREALTAAILEEIEHPAPVSGGAPAVERVAADRALDDEGRAHRAFAEDRCCVFVGREDELAGIAAYLRGEDTRPLVIVGAGGTGKSALLAESLRRAQRDHDRASVVHRFIGATAASSDARALLLGLCQELARRAGTDDSAVPTDYQELVSDLRERLGGLGADRPLLVFLDSLDQLSPNHGARGLAWLPMLLPAGVRLVVSTRPGDTLAPLEKRGAPVTELGPMTRGDGVEILGRWLEEHHRTLQPEQSDEVLAKFAASDGNPLYLRLAFQEARRWRSNDEPADREHLATGVQGIIAANTFGRLAKEENHGDVLVSHALGYLAASRYGLAEDELLDLLSRDTEVYAWFLRSAHDVPPDLRERAKEYRKPTTDDDLTRWLDAMRTGTQEKAQSELRAFLGQVLPRKNGPRLPVVLWSRLFFDLRPYLTAHETEGATLITFFHRELGDTARREFLGERAPDYHAKLADYFTPAVGEDDRPTWAAASLRGLSELPYHLIEAQRWDDVEETLTDFDFLEAKASRVAVDRHTDHDGNEVISYAGVGRLLDDFDLALRVLSGGERADLPRLIVTATDLGDGFVVRCPHCNVVHVFEGMCAPCHAFHDLDEWLGQEITCPNKTCRGPLKVNEFAAGGADAPPRRAMPAHQTPAPAGSRPVKDAQAATSRSDPRRSAGRSAMAGLDTAELRVLSDALRLASRFVTMDHTQLAGQLLARIPAGNDARLTGLLTAARSPRVPTWLRPLRASLAQSATRLILSGHNNSVQALAATPDGRLLVSASWDRTVRVWDLMTGRAVHVLEGHEQYVESVAVTWDGTRAVSGSVDGTVRVWDLTLGTMTDVFYVGEPVVGIAVHPDGQRLAIAIPSRVLVRSLDTGRVLRVVAEDDAERTFDRAGISAMSGRVGMTFMGNERDIVSLAVAPNGGRLFTGRIGGTLEWWDLTGNGARSGTFTDEEVGNTAAHRGPVWAIAPTPDGTAVVSGGEDGTARIWETGSGNRRCTLDGHDGPVHAVAVTPDGSGVVTASRGTTVRVWDTSTGSQVGVLRGHGSGVYSAVALPGGSLIASGSEDRTIRVWPLPELGSSHDEDQPIILRGHEEGVMSLAALADGTDRVVSASQDRTLKIWDVQTRTAVLTLEGHVADVLGVATTRDGHVIVSAGDNTLRVWDSATGDEVAHWSAHFLGANCVAVSTTGDRVLSGGAEGTVKLWDLDSHTLLRQFEVGSPVMAVALSADGTRALAGTADGVVVLLDLDGGTATPTGPHHRGFVRSVAFTRDGRWAVAGGLDGVTTVWDPASGTTAWELNTGHGTVGALLELADGTLAASSIDGSVVLWNLESGEALKTIQAHDGPVGALAALGDGRIVTGSGDKTLRVIQLQSSAEAEAPAHTGAVTGLAMNKEASAVFSGSGDRTVRAWDPSTGEHQAVLGGSAGPVTCLDLARDGRTLVTLTDDGWLSLWDAERRNLAHTWELGEGARALALTPDGRRAVLGGEHEIRIVSLDDGSVIKRLQPGGSSHSMILDLTVTTVGAVLVLTFDAEVRVIDLETGSERHLVGSSGHEGVLFKGPIAVDRTGRRAASVLVQHNDQRVHDNPIRVWNLDTGEAIHDLRGHTDWVRGLAFGGSDRLISAAQDGTVRVWDIEGGTTVASFGTDDQLVSVATDSASGTAIVAGGIHGALHFLQLERH